MTFRHAADDQSPAGDAAEAVGRSVLDAAFVVHDEEGPGLQEHAYREFLADELRARGLRAETEKYLPVFRHGRRVDLACRLDLLVQDLVVVEVKAVTAIHRAHVAQLVTYLRVSKRALGYVINFNEALLAAGIRRVILPEKYRSPLGTPGGASEGSEAGKGGEADERP